MRRLMSKVRQSVALAKRRIGALTLIRVPVKRPSAFPPSSPSDLLAQLTPALPP